MAENHALAFRVYTVANRGEGKEDYWLNIGAAFPHKDGKGFNVVLQALPVDGKLVLREPQGEDEQPPADNKITNVRSYRDRRSG